MICDATNRTFGIEIEMCNFDREKVVLPSGYEYSKTDTILNTDGNSDRRFGGEVNTPPLHLCHKDREDVRSVYDQMAAAGGKLKWSIATHVHIYSGDLEIDQLKSIFYLLYHCYPFVKEYCHIPDWDEKVFNAKPIVTTSHYERVKAAKTFGDLNNVFANQSQKKYLRLAFNIASHFVRNTVEFRCFNATTDFRMVENCVLATYRLFYYAINHSEEDMKAIRAYDDFVNTLKLPRETPPILTPLIFQGNQYDPKGCFCADYIGYSPKLAKALLDQKFTELCLVGGSTYAYELAFWRKMKITIYNRNRFRHALWLIANGKLHLTYTGALEWLQSFNNDSVPRQVALALYATSKVRKVIYEKNEFEKTLLAAYKAKAQQSIERLEKNCGELIEMLTHVPYVNGNLHDAMKCQHTIFYQFRENKNSHSCFGTLKRNTDIQMEIDRAFDDFYNLVEDMPDGTQFYMFSESPYLSNMHKLAVIKGSKRTDGFFLYSTHPTQNSRAYTEYSTYMGVNVNVPPTDIAIDDPKKLQICKVNSNDFHSLQHQFVKKVDKMSRCHFCYVVMYDRYCLGGFGFDFCRGNEADLWQLSDFCTNNDIPRLSKFILYCIQSRQTQRLLSRSLGRMISSVITYVYTHNPVSMKYRGAYEKVKERCSEGRLAYMSVLGKFKNIEDVITNYQKTINRQ